MNNELPVLAGDCLAGLFPAALGVGVAGGKNLRRQTLAAADAEIPHPVQHHRRTAVAGSAGSDARLERPADLKALDAAREADPGWYQQETVLGGVCYVDLCAGDLAGVRAKLPYFQELGLTYLHLMPLFKTPPGDNDGGYAVSDYRQVDPRLGSMDDLRALAACGEE
ncbi:MAG: hypothetical protein DSZ33_00345, partial [Gammaproteobacteria bacterium]